MSAAEFTEKCMRQVYSDAPMLETINNAYRDMTLAEYLHFLKEEYLLKNNSGLDADIEAAIRDYAEELIGPWETGECIRVLKETGLLYTANHHAVNFHPMTVQGNLLYEYLIGLCTDTDTFPVFSCSTIPMSNAFYPRGLLVYDTSDGQECGIPVFPFKMRRVSVSHAPVFTPGMLARATDTIRRHRSSGRISCRTAETLQTILETVYSGVPLNSCKRYGEQATLANRILSAGYRTDKNSRHIFLELEEVSGRLLCRDLADDASMLNRLLWTPECLEMIRRLLDGVSGCWSGDRAGTFLFWGVDRKGRLYRLSDASGPGPRTGLVLSGTDFDGETHCFRLDRCSLSEALKERILLPGLFMTFFSLGIARRSCLAGGCFQGEYLAKMLDGVRKAFAAAHSIHDEDLLPRPDLPARYSFPYLCGPLFLTGSNNGSRFPLSSAELWETPFSLKDLAKKLEIPFVKAQQTGLYCFYPDSVPVHLRADRWWERIAGELFANT